MAFRLALSLFGVDICISNADISICISNADISNNKYRYLNFILKEIYVIEMQISVFEMQISLIEIQISIFTKIWISAL